MGEPTLFVKYDSIRLNVVDVEKQILILKDPIKTERIEDFGKNIQLLTQFDFSF